MVEKINAARQPTDGRRLAWLDLRAVAGPQASVLVEAAVHQGIQGVIANAELLAVVPPSVRRVMVVSGASADAGASSGVDIVLCTLDGEGDLWVGAGELGAYVEVRDQPSLDLATKAALHSPWLLVSFRDPTKIPLEILLAAADNASGVLISAVADLAEAEVVLGVLENGPDGVCLAPTSVADIAALAALCLQRVPRTELQELRVVDTAYAGLGDRGCVDTCSYLEQDEGILGGSFSRGLLLACSETHRLPYMPTRPFRVNLGAIHSYVLGPENRTKYLSELRAGDELLAVRTDGSTRVVTVGRVKIERRPLLNIVAMTPEGMTASLVVQADWHVRMLAPGGQVHNVTELKSGDSLLGRVLQQQRHVGYPLTEFCVEQ